MNNVGQINNNTSFGMAWTPKSKELFSEIVDATVDNIGNRRTRTGLAEFVSRRVDNHRLGEVKSVGKMVRAQNLASNAIERDYDLRLLQNGNLVCDVLDFRNGGRKVSTIKLDDMNKKKPPIHNLKLILKKVKKYTDHQFAKIDAQDANAAKITKKQVEAAKLEAKLLKAQQVRGASSRAIGQSAGRDINILK